MAASVPILMRALRAANGSFHYWRATGFDSDMSEAVGNQAPPFPVIDYSDFVVVGYAGGNVAVSDTEGIEVLNTEGAPGEFLLTSEVSANSDVNNYSEIEWFIYITNKATLTDIRCSVAYSDKETPGVNDYATLKAEDVTAGLATLDTYEANFDISGESVPFVLSISAPVRGRKMLLSIKGIGTETGSLFYVRAFRRIN